MAGTRHGSGKVASPTRSRIALVTLAVVGTVGAGVAIVVGALGSARLSGWHLLGLLVASGMLLLAENAAVLLPTNTSVSPSVMVVMAAIAALDRSSSAGLVVGAVGMGFLGGLPIAELRRRHFVSTAYNCAQYGLATGAAAAVYTAFPSSGAATLLGGTLGTAAFAAVNVALVLPYMSLKHGRRASEVWADMRPALPNFVAFGLLGVLVGNLSAALGVLVLPLLLIPAVIARSTFNAYLRLKQAQESAIAVFVRAIEAKDAYTAGHCERVARYAAYMGEQLGYTAARLEQLRNSALMHDIGKLAVPATLLNKPGRLTPEEYAEVRRHNDVCIEILTRVDFLRSAVPVASDRHAFYDGADADPAALDAYVVAVADAFDAMTSTRSYRKALSQDVAFSELGDKAGTQFDPRCVVALIAALEQRDERYGLGYETDVVQFAVEPPTAGLGSAGLDYHTRAAAAH
jgi:hypothetical protein